MGKTPNSPRRSSSGELAAGHSVRPSCRGGYRTNLPVLPTTTVVSDPRAAPPFAGGGRRNAALHCRGRNRGGRLDLGQTRQAGPLCQGLQPRRAASLLCTVGQTGRPSCFPTIWRSQRIPAPFLFSFPAVLRYSTEAKLDPKLIIPISADF